MHKLTVNGIELTAVVQDHDQSVTGIHYKLVVTLPKRLPKRRQCRGPITLNTTCPKPKPDPIAPWVLDLGNALYRDLGFKYTLNPWVDRGKGYTMFTYHFNDIDQAVALGYQISDALYSVYKRNQERNQAEGYRILSHRIYTHELNCVLTVQTLFRIERNINE